MQKRRISSKAIVPGRKVPVLQQHPVLADVQGNGSLEMMPAPQRLAGRMPHVFPAKESLPITCRIVVKVVLVFDSAQLVLADLQNL